MSTLFWLFSKYFVIETAMEIDWGDTELVSTPKIGIP